MTQNTNRELEATTISSVKGSRCDSLVTSDSRMPYVCKCTSQYYCSTWPFNHSWTSYTTGQWTACCNAHVNFTSCSYTRIDKCNISTSDVQGLFGMSLSWERLRPTGVHETRKAIDHEDHWHRSKQPMTVIVAVYLHNSPFHVVSNSSLGLARQLHSCLCCTVSVTEQHVHLVYLYRLLNHSLHCCADYDWQWALSHSLLLWSLRVYTWFSIHGDSDFLSCTTVWYLVKRPGHEAR